MAKTKSKYVGFSAQREQCRLNKYTYTEKCTCGTITLMCNYPFDLKEHKKGVCRASTCTDMRKTLAEDLSAISSLDEVVKDETAKEYGDDVLINAKDNISPDGKEKETPLTGVDGAYDEVTKENAAKEEDPKGAVRAE